MEIKNPLPCCTKSLRKHGGIGAFVTMLYTCPASSVEAYQAEQTELNLQLLAAGVCKHFAAGARVYHTTMLANQKHATTLVAANFYGVDPQDVEELEHL
jgi:hypothetical protein